MRLPSASHRGLSVAAAAVLVTVGVPALVIAALGAPTAAHIDALASNPELDPGTSLSKPAPGFKLTDQFGRQVSLSSFRGKVVILAFNDSECTTVCPLTTTAMMSAKAMLGAAGNQVQLLGIDANPRATSLEDVLSYSELHGMTHAWHFLTGSPAQLKQVWRAYSIGVQITQKQIDHTPAVFVIDPAGRVAKLYVTQQSYAAVGQFGQILAQEAASLLPSHPRVHSHLSYARISGIAPTATATLPRAGGGTVGLGPGGHGYLLPFFDTWDREITGIAGELDALNGYQSSAAASGLPPLTAIDEASVEASPNALSQFLGGLPKPLSFPVALDTSGRLADGYQVLGEPWLVLTSPSGRILWYWEVSTSGWLGRDALVRHVRAALASVPRSQGAERQLAGSPAPLAALHEQAGRLLGSVSALRDRIQALRGYPVVVNVWASWCTPCRSEFGLFATASVQFGRKVAFLGVDANDSAADAQAFLAQHPVSYPSYQGSTADLGSMAQIEGLPTTIFLNRAGKVVFVHTGEYDSAGSLEGDIGTYAGGG